MTKLQYEILTAVYNEFPAKVFFSLPEDIKAAWYRILFSKNQEAEFSDSVSKKV
jgi:hypothetical protein